MLSVSNVSGGAAASGYYKTEGYYKAGSPEAEAAAQWHGKAAEALAIAGRQEFQGTVDDGVFTDVLENAGVFVVVSLSIDAFSIMNLQKK